MKSAISNHNYKLLSNDPPAFAQCNCKSVKECPLELMENVYPKLSGEAGPTFGHANAMFLVFTDRIMNQFLKK